jgi:hypothetical protein
LWDQYGPQDMYREVAEALAEFKFRQTSDYKEIPFVTCCTLSQARDYWRNRADEDGQ